MERIEQPATRSSSVDEVGDRARAEALDAADPLAAFRDRFVIDDPSIVYLDGNSLGRLPRSTVDRLATLVRDGGAAISSAAGTAGSAGRPASATGSARRCSVPARARRSSPTRRA